MFERGWIEHTPVRRAIRLTDRGAAGLEHAGLELRATRAS
jgi:hypothetical protein